MNKLSFTTGWVALWFLLSFLGLIFYLGNPFIYIAFCSTFLLLTLVGLRCRNSFSYIFAIIFLGLGFWLKLIVHLLLKYNYLEPIGSFEQTSDSWDQVLLVINVGLLGVIFAKDICELILKFSNKTNNNSLQNIVPYWYPKARKKLWILVGVLLLSLTIINFNYGIFQVGLVPTLFLPWPLNGLMSWLLGFGLAIAINTLVFWDQSIKADWKIGLSLVLVESLSSTVSILSRATYIFHSVPYLTVFYNKFKCISFKTKLRVFILWISLLSVSIVSVTLLRYSDVSPIDASNNKSLRLKDNNFLSANILLGIGGGISALLVDRWVGLEGVMAVVSYPKKSIETFEYALNETRVKNKIDFYTQSIARVVLTDAEISKYQYATIPGAIAFFYYSGSLVFVFFGITCLTFLMLVIESLILYMTKNPYLVALWGMSVAQTVVSFGLGVKQTLSFYFVSLVAIIFIYFVQTVSYQKEKSIN